MVEFDFEKFRSTCNNPHNLLDLTDNDDKELFIDAIYTNRQQCTPLVLGPNGAYAYWHNAEPERIYGVRRDDSIYGCKIYTVQDFIIQKFNSSAVLEFLKE